MSRKGLGARLWLEPSHTSGYPTRSARPRPDTRLSGTGCLTYYARFTSKSPRLYFPQ